MEVESVIVASRLAPDQIQGAHLDSTLYHKLSIQSIGVATYTLTLVVRFEEGHKLRKPKYITFARSFAGDIVVS
jgi:hypothetical protein